MSAILPRIVILGAGGLIGHGVAIDLMRRGLPVIGVARRLSAAQKAALGPEAVEMPLVDLSESELTRQLRDLRPDVVVNAIGILQDGPLGLTDEVHLGFVERLLAAMPSSALLIHVSVPGFRVDDRTDFSRTKRAAEDLVHAAARPYVILRPGFVVAPAAFGGSALVRALASLPLLLPAREARAPFAATALGDIADTIDLLARRWAAGERGMAATWDVMESDPGTVGGVVAAARRHFGGPNPFRALPSWFMDAGAWVGDLVSRLGWQPPVRSTALAELRRGVTGDPRPWSAATGLKGRNLDTALALAPATVQENWFARLFLLKALMIATLAVFWSVSGLIALTVAFDSARDILLSAGFSQPIATAVTVISSLADVSVGALIAIRRTCRLGLILGICVSLFYMAGTAILTPHLWIEPLGALVKTGPAIVLMLAAWAILDDRP